jgi:opacity protein-like surface antigen
MSQKKEKLMKRFLLTASVLFATASSLNAAANFSGFQGGLLLGVSSNRMKITDVPANPTAPLMTNGGLLAPTGFAAGIQIGYGTAMNGVFLGLDGRIFKDLSSEKVNFYASDVGRTEFTAETKGVLPFDVAVKIGTPMENALPFVRLGFAHSSYKIKVNRTVTGLEAGKLKSKQSGMIAGIGIDFLATPCVLVGMGYDMTVAPKAKATTYDETGNKLKIKPARHTVMLRIAYKI